MSFKSIANSISSFFSTLATTNNFVVRYDNDPRNTPTDKIWMNVNVDFGDSHQAEIGVPTFRHIGIFNVRIKIPIGLGVADALDIADIIVAGFKGANGLPIILDGIINFQTFRIENVGRVEDNHQVNVICPFQVDN